MIFDIFSILGESSTSSRPSETPGEPCSSNSTEQNHHTVYGSILVSKIHHIFKALNFNASQTNST